MSEPMPTESGSRQQQHHVFPMRLPASTMKAAVTILFVSVALFATWPVFHPRHEHELSIPSRSLDFGRVWSQRGLQRTLRIYNPTGNDIEIGSVKASCHCTGVRPTAFVVPSNGSAEMTVTLDVFPKEGVTASLSTPYLFTTHLIATAVRPTSAVYKWTIRCHVENPLKLSASEIVFDESSNRNASEHCFVPQQLRYDAAVPLKSLATSVGRDDIQVIVQRETDTSGLLIVCPDGSIAPGDFDGLLEIRPMSKSGTMLPPVQVSIKGVSLHDLYLSPPVLAFGFVDVDSMRKASVELSSRSGREFSVISVDSDDESLRVTPLAGARNDNARFEVQQRIVAPGAHSAMVHFRGLTKWNEQVDVQLPVAYIGVQLQGRK